MNWKLTIFLIAAFTFVSCYVVYDKQHRKVKQLKTELDMCRAELGVFKDKANKQRDDSKQYGMIVRDLKDSIEYFQNLAFIQTNKITQLEKQKNEIIRKDYSKHSDSDLSQLLIQLFTEADSLP